MSGGRSVLTFGGHGTLRNAAGHPTGKAVPRNDIAAHILLLPAFLRRVRSLRSTVAVLP